MRGCTSEVRGAGCWTPVTVPLLPSHRSPSPCVGAADILAACAERGVPPKALARVAACVEGSLREVAARIRCPSPDSEGHAASGPPRAIVQQWEDRDRGDQQRGLLQSPAPRLPPATVHLGPGSADHAPVRGSPQAGHSALRRIPLSALELLAAELADARGWPELRGRGRAALTSRGSLSLRDASLTDSAEAGAACLAQPRVAGLRMAVETVETLARVEAVAPAAGRRRAV